MYEIGEAWMGYFEEIDPAKRLQILDGMEEQSGAMMRLCRGFYRERYTDPKKPAHKVDNWLYKFVYFPGMYRRCGRRIGRSGLEKEMARSLKELHLEDPEGLEELERTVLYHEFRNAARRYLDTCRDPAYGSKLLKMKSSTEAERKALAGEEMWQISSGLPAALGVAEKMGLWKEAILAELLVFDPEAGPAFDAREGKAGT